MRILVLVYEFPPVGGGGGAVALDIARELAQRGYEIALLTSHHAGLARQTTIDGVRVFRINSFRRHLYKADFLSMAGYILMGFLPALQLVRRFRPDVIHVHFAVPSGPLAWIVSKLSGIPYLLTAHLGDVPGGVPEKTQGWFRWVYPFTPAIWRDAARVVAVSEHTRQLALKRYPVDIQVIPNGVNLNLLDPGEIQVGRPPRVIFAGRFVHQKNPLQIVRALAENADLPWTCVLLGDGALRPQIEAEIARTGLSDRFHLPGWVTPEEVVAWLKKCDILLHAILIGRAVGGGRASCRHGISRRRQQGRRLHRPG